MGILDESLRLKRSLAIIVVKVVKVGGPYPEEPRARKSYYDGYNPKLVELRKERSLEKLSANLPELCLHLFSLQSCGIRDNVSYLEILRGL